jgi:hypothetical protein
MKDKRVKEIKQVIYDYCKSSNYYFLLNCNKDNYIDYINNNYEQIISIIVAGKTGIRKEFKGFSKTDNINNMIGISRDILFDLKINGFEEYQ